MIFMKAAKVRNAAKEMQNEKNPLLINVVYDPKSGYLIDEAERIIETPLRIAAPILNAACSIYSAARYQSNAEQTPATAVHNPTPTSS